MKIQHLPETVIQGRRLGRHVEHDPRSRAFAHVPQSTALVYRHWQSHAPVYDQGDLGSCTGNAMAGAIMTGPLYSPSRVLTEADAVKLYEAATLLDGIPGHYPPTDTGSSGLAVACAAKRMGWIKGYKHAFGLQVTLSAVSHTGPVIAGINWYEGFDQPQGLKFEIKISGSVRGGHEVCIVGIDVVNRLVIIRNSWGPGWGNAGYCTMSWDTLDQLLHESGDVVVPG